MKITIFVFNPKRHWTLTILKGASEPWTKIKVVVKRVTCGHQNKDKSWWHKRGEFDRCWHAVKCHDMTTSLNIHQLFSNTRIFTVLTYFLENNKQWLTYNSFFFQNVGLSWRDFQVFNTSLWCECQILHGSRNEYRPK